MTKQDYVNEKVTLPLGNTRVRVGALGIVEILAHLENIVLANHRAAVLEMAQDFDGKMRAEYIMAERKNLPKGKELSEAALDLIPTIQGVQALVTKAIMNSNPLSADEVQEIFDSVEDEDEFLDVFNVVAGTLLAAEDEAEEEEEEKEDNALETDAQKKAKEKKSRKSDKK